MKLNKKTTMIVSFALGTLLFASTALADIANKSGYEQLKDSLKSTAQACSADLTSFTLEANIVAKDNGKILNNTNDIVKFDISSGASENYSSSESPRGGIRNYYSYEDKNTTIRKGSDDETYYVSEYSQERKSYYSFSNPFEEDGMQDVERIVDALVGSLKDHVVVSENADGSKEFSGSLNEIQIPALINAVASFQIKREFNDDRVLVLNTDIFVKEINGFASVNPDGFMESIRGSATLSGKDSTGQVHELTLDILYTLSDINSTVVSKPDLTNKKTVKETVHESDYRTKLTNPQKFIGKYKNDIVIEEDSRFVKIGERFVELTDVNHERITGKYYEVFAEGYEQYASSGQKEFAFDAEFKSGGGSYRAHFDYTDDSQTVREGSVGLDPDFAQVYLEFYPLKSPLKSDLQYHSIFSIVLD